MRFDTVFILFFISLVTLAIVHVFAQIFFLYWLYLWFDIPVHFLGGIVVALGYQSASSLRIMLPKTWLNILPTIIFVMLVSVAWEIFEVVADVPFTEDTAFDLIIDFFGGIGGYFLAVKMRSLET